MVVQLSSRGHLTIPKTIRQALGLRTGAEFRVHLREGKIVLEPLETFPVETLYGKYSDTDFLIEKLERNKSSKGGK